MSYRVEYNSELKWEHKDERKGSSRYLWTGLFFLCFLMFVNLCWEEGKEVLFQILLPGDAHVTWNGMLHLSDNLRQGIPFSFAVQEFCNEMLQGCY